MFFSPSTDIVSFETHNPCPRTAGCDITGRAPAVTMTSYPKRPIQVPIIDNLCLNLPEIVSQQSCDPSFCSLNRG